MFVVAQIVIAIVFVVIGWHLKEFYDEIKRGTGND
jgi:hypothetical protein